MNKRYQTGRRRVAAAIVDALLLTLPSSVIWASVSPESMSPDSLTLQIGLSIGYEFLPLVYSVVLHWWLGQTIGKKIVGIKVLDASETRLPSLGQALTRDGVWLVLLGLQLTLTLGDWAAPGWVVLVCANAGPVWLLLELGTMLLNAKRRAIHDLMAGTVVVRV